jgi:hypothetical protein
VIDVGSGKEILKSIKHGGEVRSVCYSPDGKSVATGSWDKFLRVFDVGSGKEILKSIEHGGWVRSVCYSPDGKSVATGSDDNFSRIFNIEKVEEDGDEEEKGISASQNASLKLVMMFLANSIAISSNFSIAISNGPHLHLLPRPHNFSVDICLPPSPSFVLHWSRLSEEHQKQCFFTDSDVLLSEFWASEGGGLFSLASKWRDPDYPHVVATLKRLF